ncbi:MAG: hypothetical protein ABF289_09465 [Clostridiales bacterium]
MMLLMPERKNNKKLVLLKIKFDKWKIRLTNNKLICKIIKINKNKLHDKSYDNGKNFDDNEALTTQKNFKININAKSVNKLIITLSPYEISKEKNCDFEEENKVSSKNDQDLYIQFASFVKNNSQGSKIPSAKELETVFDISERRRRKYMAKMESESLIEKQGKLYKLISNNLFKDNPKEGELNG